MKKSISTLVALIFLSILFLHSTEAADLKQITVSDPTNIFPKGEQLKSPYFTGRVWLSMLVPQNNPLGCPIGNVTFEPGCRNNWHKHPGGQVLLVTSGKGYYQERGKAAQLLLPGDVVTIAPHVEHWHGATPDAWFTHLSITPNTQAGAAVWLEPVTKEIYDAAGVRQSGSSAGVPRLTETALKNHDILFPHHQSTLSITDPELIEVFDNFAFDEILQYGNLDEKTRIMTILAACIASQALTEYRVMLGAALNIGVTPVEAKEVLYQAVPYVGIAKVYDFIHATNEVLSARGIALPLEGQSITSPEDRHEKGLALQKAIFGERIDKMYQDSPVNQRHIQKYLSANCFGDHVSRKGLDIKMRELLTFSMLLALGGCEPQLKGHIQGNVNVGNDKVTLLSVATQLIPYVGYPRTLNAIRCLNEVLPEAQ